MVEWLKNHIEPASKVLWYMRKTSIKRLAWIRENPNLSIDDIIKAPQDYFDITGMVSNIS